MLVAKDIAYDARVRRSARSLAQHGYEVTVACVSEDGEQRRRVDGYEVLTTPIVLAQGASGRLADHQDGSTEWERIVGAELEPYATAWGPLLRTRQPGIVHVHDHHGLDAARAACGPATRLIYDAHEHLLGKDLRPVRHRAFAEFLKRNVPRMDAVVTVSAALAKALKGELRLPRPPVVVHNAPSLADREDPPYDLRTAIGVDAWTPLLVYTGSVTKRRRIATPLRVLTRLPDVHLALVLNGDKLVSQFEQEAEALGVRERVHFAPRVPPEALISLIRTANIGINPLDRYGNGDVALPNKLFEYLHAGLPMVVSDAPQMAKFVRVHRLGEVAPSDDEEAWARAIERILTDPEAYQGEPEARESLCREWSWESQEPVLLELYEQLTPPADRASFTFPESPTQAPLRVLHGVLGSANQPWTLASALRRRGHASENIAISPHRFGYEAGITKPVKRMSIDQTLELVEDLAAWFDIFHFHACSFVSGPDFDFPGLIDLVQLRLLGKTVVFHFRGTEARLKSEFSKRNRFVDRRLFPHDEDAQRRMIDFVRSVADAALVNDPEIQTYVPGAEIVPRAIDLEEWQPVRPTRNRRPRVLHAPSNEGRKGTGHVLAAVESLREEGLAFDFELIKDRPHEEAREAYERADILVDQLMTGWYCVQAVEGMSLAKPVISYIRPDLLDRLGPEPPVAPADPATFKSVLRGLILDADARARLGETARRYCESVHSADVVAAQLERIYHDLQDGARRTPASPDAIRGYIARQAALFEQARKPISDDDEAEPSPSEPAVVTPASEPVEAGKASARRVLMLVPGESREEPRSARIAASLAEDGYEVVRLPVPAQADSRDKAFRGALKQCVRREAPNIIHVRDQGGLRAALSSQGLGTRIVFDPDGTVADGLSQHLPRVDAVLASSEEDAERLAEFELSGPPVVLSDEASPEAQKDILLDLYERLLAPRDDAWYDRMFAGSERYRLPYAESIYYPCWMELAPRLAALGPTSVLDVGCGPGQFAALLRDAGIPQYLGIDFSRVAVEMARDVCPEFEFLVEDVRTAGALETHPYDVMVCLETLEHIEEDREVLLRIRAGTPVIATVPDFPGQSHVRHFTDEDEVLGRYGGVLADLRVEHFPLNAKAGLFILEGVRSD
jgi:glycosyltransferase involved in cell wall biosynthesis/SAM-dependent methyltransferase